MITIHDNFAKRTSIVDDLYQTISSIGDLQLEFMPHSYVVKANQRNTLETHVATLIKEIINIFPPFKGKGYEVWFNTLADSTPYLDHHVDCDEEAEEVIPAKYTATFYLGAEIDGGELAVHTEEYYRGYDFKSNIWAVKHEAETNPDWLTIPYKYNRLVLFESKFPHAVLPIVDMKGGKRVSLTISTWDRPINVIKNV
jgi:Rps23 Pro-64 3,4-dihydroxylase Tpa1-like proline 4-hydroxylase